MMAEIENTQDVQDAKDAQDAQDTEKYLLEMKNWLKSQPHLPNDVDDFLLLRFIHSCYYDMEKAKLAAEAFFTIRGTTPEVFSDRDPVSTSIEEAFKHVRMAQLKLSGNRNLFIYQLNDPGMRYYDYNLDAKCNLLCLDAWLLENKVLEEGDYFLVDAKDISYKFIFKMNYTLARKLTKYQENAVPIRLKQMHVVNAPSIMDRLFSIMKPFLSQETTDMIHFHLPNSETIYEYFSKDELPEDYGGTLDCMEIQMKTVMGTIMKHRDRLNSNLWKLVDKKTIRRDSPISKMKNEPKLEIPTFNLAID